MRTLVDAVIAVLLAPACASCHEPLPHPTRGCVCDDCWTRVDVAVARVCPSCGGPHPESALLTCADCVRHPPLVTAARAIGPYDGPLRAIVHALKYDGRRTLAGPLAARMAVAGASIVEGCTAVVAVPLHPSRRRARGFNQAADLASHLALPGVAALRRVRNTHTQTTLPADARRSNVAGAFEPTRDAAHLRGRIVLLIDDVRTTGATLDACAAALLEVGVREVRALTAARVATPGA